ncbi:MAG TPA: tRNA lysidine(34) synthetase TilS [Ilumatobacter sp.]|nr:tRNA lysidine(34) synthetase TilS [Ilumatobacter sp.]
MNLPPSHADSFPVDPSATLTSIDKLVARCTFPAAGTSVDCAFSGGPDSTALVALAHHAGLVVTAHHVDHGLRSSSIVESEHAARLADQLGAAFVVHRPAVTGDGNLEARARLARRNVLPSNAMTGHTADDQAETVLMRLLRGSGVDGLAAMQPGEQHPILALRRSDTEFVCAAFGLQPIRDPSNQSSAIWRNRVRHELLPLASAIFQRDVVPILTRTADLYRDDAALLEELAGHLDPTDALAIAAAPLPLARRALRVWLTIDGYPPDAASVDRVLAVARNDAVACELSPGIRVERTGQRLRCHQTARNVDS